MAEGIENRRYQRIIFTAPLTVKNKSDKKELAHGVTSNISIGGLGIKLKQGLQTGVVYIFEFHLSDGKRFDLPGKVAWTQPAHFSSEIWYGIQFVKIGFFQKLALNGFVKHELKKGTK